MDERYDVIIIGAGPAGLTAGIYCAQAGLNVLAVEEMAVGGDILNIENIENYPGFSDGVSGAQLGAQMMMQAMNYGVQIQLVKAVGLEIGPTDKRVKTGRGDYLGRAVIIAGGARPKKLGVPGEEAFIGSGVGYCAMCDGGQFAGKTVVVCGGGDAGITDALYMTKLASRVIVVEVMPQLNAISLLQERAGKNEKIEIVCSTRIEAIEGESKVTAVKLLNSETKELTTLPVDGVLVRVGLEPATDYLQGIVPLDSQGHILVNDNMETEVAGVLAAGDIRHGSPMQVATAVGDGTIAAISAQKYLSATT